MSSEMNIDVDMRVSGTFFGGPAPTIFQIFSNCFCFQRHSPTLLSSHIPDSNDLKGAFQDSIGEFLSKFCKKRRKYWRALGLILTFLRFSNGFCEDTEVFVSLIDQIVSQFDIDHGEDPAGGADPDTDTVCSSQFAEIMLPLNSDSFNLSKFTDLSVHSICTFVLSTDYPAAGTHSICFQGGFTLFDSFLFPPFSPHIQFRQKGVPISLSNFSKLLLETQKPLSIISLSILTKPGRSSWLYTPLSNSPTYSIWRS
jgi:hypothetical protein